MATECPNCGTVWCDAQQLGVAVTNWELFRCERRAKEKALAEVAVVRQAQTAQDAAVAAVIAEAISIGLVPRDANLGDALKGYVAAAKKQEADLRTEIAGLRQQLVDATKPKWVDMEGDAVLVRGDSHLAIVEEYDNEWKAVLFPDNCIGRFQSCAEACAAAEKACGVEVQGE